MKFKPEKKYFHIGLTIFLTAIAIMLAYFLFFRLESIKALLNSFNKIIAPIFYGFVLAYLMSPLLNVAERKWITPLVIKKDLLKKSKNKKKTIRTISVAITIVIVLLVLYLFFVSVVPQVYSSIQSLLSSYETYTNNLVNWLNKVMENNPALAGFLSQLVYNASSEADDFLNEVALPALKNLLLPNMTGILTTLSASIVKFLTFLWNVLIGLIISIYVLSGKEKFVQGMARICYAVLPTDSANKFVNSIRFTHKTLINFLGGKVIDSAIIGILCYITCLILKMPYSLLISVVIGVTNIIPFFGPFIGAIPSALIILLVDPKKALTFVIFIIILQQIDGNIIGPKILSQSTGVTSFWIIFSITVFGGFWGVFGMIIGVPVTAVLITFIDKWTKSKLKSRNLPEEPENYLGIEKITEDGEIIKHIPEPKDPKKLERNKAIGKCFKGIGFFLKKAIIFIFESIKIIAIKIGSFFKNRFKK